MRIFLTGASGVIGKRVMADRVARGDELVALARDLRRARTAIGEIDPGRVHFVEGDATLPGSWMEAVAGCDAVIHLAGSGIADHRWTKAYKEELFFSRIDSTRRIVEAIAATKVQSRPRVLLNASAIGYYGDGGERELDEQAPPGEDFLAVLTAAWEREAQRAEAIDESPPRVVLLRTGVVLDHAGGALPKMMAPFRIFVGGPLGNGRQWVSWIHWRDLMGLIDLALVNSEVFGPLNLVSPQPVRNREFARALGRAMHRPAFFPTPKFALRMALGEVADAVAASQRVIPTKALQFGYEYQFPQLDRALADLRR